ncbi:MAG: transcription termination factor Rho [Nocardioides sp.]|nr:transcription termination factor Rho [Nocardioides sp.]
MTETPATAEAQTSQAPAKKRGGGLTSMLLADLKSMAAGLGVPGAGSMKKAQLIEAIKAAQGAPRGSSSAPAQTGADVPAGTKAARKQESAAEEQQPAADERSRDRQEKSRQPQDGQQDGKDDQQGGKNKQGKDQGKDRSARKQGKSADQGSQDEGRKDEGRKEPQARGEGGANQQSWQNQQGQNQQPQQQNQQAQNQNQQAQHAQQDQDDDGEGGSRRNRRRRGRDRTVTRQGGRNEPDTTILEDDVLVPAAGILDVLDNYAFVRTSGYLPGTEDVYLSLSMVRKYGLRRGDAVVGQVRQPREGERREKFNPMVRIDSVNGVDPEAAKDRVEFTEATPVHPSQRLRLTTDEANTIGRVIDVAAPLGKGQRGLVLAPPRTGTTTLLKSVATSIATNNPECHVMVVLVDTRPEEVTDFQRAVKGEVIASTFDREPSDHTLVAELAIERAKRLVEMGHDVVVLLDSLTALGRAYNLAAPANGRVLSGGVDASAVHPTKQFFGAARNIEDGGSLTILASVPVETGSQADEFFLEVLSGAANLELRLSSERAGLDLVPAVDVTRSRTRHEELLLAPAESAVVGEVRQKLAAVRTQQELVKVLSGR